MALGALIGLIRIRQVDRRFLPFIGLLWLGLLNEFISDFSIKHWQTNAPNTNIYFLFEAFLIVWQFAEWRLFSKRRTGWVIAFSFVAVWVCEVLLFKGIQQFSSYYHIFACFVCVLLSIQYINRLIFSNSRLSLKNPEFLICSGFIFFNTLMVLVEVFWIYGLDVDFNFSARVYEIITYVNLLTNLIFAIAALWIPRKQTYLVL